VLFDLIFLALFTIGWLICAFVPWLALSVATRGDAGLGYLPACLAVGVVAALAVPLLGLTDGRGLALSFVAAAAAPAMLLAAGRFSHASRSALAEQRRAAHCTTEDPQAE
jgi:hypothetical protein